MVRNNIIAKGSEEPSAVRLIVVSYLLPISERGGDGVGLGVGYAAVGSTSACLTAESWDSDESDAGRLSPSTSEDSRSTSEFTSEVISTSTSQVGSLQLFQTGGLPMRGGKPVSRGALDTPGTVRYCAQLGTRGEEGAPRRLPGIWCSTAYA